MQFGLTLPPFGAWSDIHRLSKLAVDAEDAGWDGFFIWDHMVMDTQFHPMVDPWIAISAIASQTTHIKLGILVTAVARRRPWKLARETVSLDNLSKGRLIFGAGLGEPASGDFGLFHEETDAKIRAQKLDEGLEILTGLWTGERFDYSGQHYQLEPVQFLPTATQKPRIPVWVGGGWDKLKPLQRAVKYDGYFPLKFGHNLTLDEWRWIQNRVSQHRQIDTPLDLIHGGYLPDDHDEALRMVAPYADFGLSWWVENVEPWRWGHSWSEPIPLSMIESMEARIRQGPPRLE